MENFIDEQFKDLLELQDYLNDKTNGKTWTVDSLSNNERAIFWPLCFLNELGGELVGSTPFEHWKPKQELDLNNMLVELVDMGHFLLSMHLRLRYLHDLTSKHGVSTIGDNPAIAYADITHKEDVNRLYPNMVNISVSKPNGVTVMDIISYAMMDINKQFSTIDYAPFIAGCTYMENIGTTGFNLKVTFDKILQLYAYIMGLVSGEDTIASETVISHYKERYMLKNALNKLRQTYGYKIGNYSKLWDGKEDNEKAVELLEEYKARDDIPAEIDIDVMGNLLSEYYLSNIYLLPPYVVDGDRMVLTGRVDDMISAIADDVIGIETDNLKIMSITSFMDVYQKDSRGYKLFQDAIYKGAEYLTIRKEEISRHQ